MGCICKNRRFSNFPECNDVVNPCQYFKCGREEKCLVINGEATCVCKNGESRPPYCDDRKLCGPEHQKACEEKNGKCVIMHLNPTCICKSESGTFPHCGETPLPGCTEQSCVNGYCKNNRCICKKKDIPCGHQGTICLESGDCVCLNGKKPPCGGGCNKQNCKNGYCKNDECICKKKDIPCGRHGGVCTESGDCVCLNGKEPPCGGGVGCNEYSCINGNCVNNECVCKYGGYPPNCKDPPICGGKKCPNGYCKNDECICIKKDIPCGRHGGKCSESGDCLCQNGGTPPCHIPCEERCPNGICENDQCSVCLHGGIPPLCGEPPPGPCKYKDCGKGKCIVNEEGIAVCVCSTEVRCGPTEGYCSLSGKCECTDGSNPPCKNDCGTKVCDPKWETCLKDVETGKEFCKCLYGGQPGKCKNCDKICKENQVCVLTEGGKSVCKCKDSSSEECPDECRHKKCEQGKCVKIDGQEKCVCHDNSRNYPDCDGPCSLINCINGKCVTVNGQAKCVCYDGSDNHPDCNYCDKLRCHEKGEKCVESKERPRYYECVCENYPNCEPTPCDCPPDARCVYQGGKVYCQCKNGEGVFPKCKYDPCNSDLIEYCEQNNGECMVENSLGNCICKQGFFGLFPDCQTTPTTPVCSETCRGKCIYNEEMQTEECICTNGGIPPLCLQVCTKHCGNAHCIIDAEGVQKCVCDDPNLDPPYCFNSCQNRCQEGEICDKNGECICGSSGQEKTCRPICTKKCGKFAECYKAYSPIKEHCRCLYGGFYPNCKQYNCKKACKKDEVCSINPITGREECKCRSLQTNCKACTLRCKTNEKCVLEKGKKKCICKDNSSDDICDGPCTTKTCPGGKCIVNSQGQAKCICGFETSSRNSKYPRCDECSVLNCEARDGRCMQTNYGQYTCICKNNLNNFPICKDVRCYPACQSDQECV